VSVRVERRGGVDVLWLDRPERHNALVPALVEALAEHLRRPGRAVVLTGAGRSFCVGADLAWLQASQDPAESVALLVAAHHAAVGAMREAPVPVLAAVNGAAAGGGLSLALAADVRLAGARATFTCAYSRLGLPPDGGTSAFLLRAVGASRAMELLLLNRSLGATEALAWGLVNEVVPDEELVDRACALGEALGDIPPETLVATRRLLDAAGALPLETVLQREALAMRAASRRPAFQERLARWGRARWGAA
jgi:2-(1,2-epoxy-1,2-dihydrophenyl)acetyl-CoA isomerase